MYILGYTLCSDVMNSFFCPTIQVWPASGARTLLHIGTHRKEYKDLDPNHLYYMRWRLQGLVKSPFVDDVDIGDSRKAFEWLWKFYREMRNQSFRLEMKEMESETMKAGIRSRSYSV